MRLSGPIQQAFNPVSVAISDSRNMFIITFTSTYLYTCIDGERYVNVKINLSEKNSAWHKTVLSC